MRTFALAAVVLSLAAGQASAATRAVTVTKPAVKTAPAAAKCRDGKGKFTTCPAPAAAKASCKDAKGKFAKCGSPGVRPA